jgi:hypothetical protein
LQRHVRNNCECFTTFPIVHKGTARLQASAPWNAWSENHTVPNDTQYGPSQQGAGTPTSRTATKLTCTESIIAVILLSQRPKAWAFILHWPCIRQVQGMHALVTQHKLLHQNCHRRKICSTQMTHKRLLQGQQSPACALYATSIDSDNTRLK